MSFLLVLLVLPVTLHAPSLFSSEECPRTDLEAPPVPQPDHAEGLEVAVGEAGQRREVDMLLLERAGTGMQDAELLKQAFDLRRGISAASQGAMEQTAPEGKIDPIVKDGKT